MKERGFTLFELLVSISIIAILTALVSLSYSSAQKKARDVRRIKDMQSIQTAAEQFYALSNYLYPAGTGAPANWTVNGEVILQVFPTDPKGVGWTAYVSSFTPASSYCVCAAVENTSNGNSNLTDCSAFAATGAYYCVKNQQ